ncbi:MAG: nucleotidyltransferase domain-containing protein [Methylococcales bacterium]|nr:nucleotidyltransferase domain-containing protein [Methylococcales bacterium]MDD5755064.1 nucleotidyltransferase domain-containing protein [Methylococcales bacterium]
MRLTPIQIQLIKNTVDHVLDVSNKVWLFGSRVDDSQRGGDIDLFIEVQTTLKNRADTICQLYAAFIMVLGDCKIDVVLKDERTVDAPIFQIAKRTGILL